MIRESQMVNLMKEKNLDLSAPMEPPYEIKAK